MPWPASTEPVSYRVKRELRRKAFHLPALLIPIGYLIVPRQPALGILALLAGASLFLDLGRLRYRRVNLLFIRVLRRVLRVRELRGVSGFTYLVSGTFICVLFFDRPVALAAIFFFIVGDGLAALVGRVWGRTPLMAQKTLEGSLACFCSNLLVGLAIPGLPPVVALIGAAVSTLVELIPVPVDDNFSVPVVSGLVMHLALGYV